jgi:hypothetical protein
MNAEEKSQATEFENPLEKKNQSCVNSQPLKVYEEYFVKWCTAKSNTEALFKSKRRLSAGLWHIIDIRLEFIPKRMTKLLQQQK